MWTPGTKAKSSASAQPLNHPSSSWFGFLTKFYILFPSYIYLILVLNFLNVGKSFYFLYFIIFSKLLALSSHSHYIPLTSLFFYLPLMLVHFPHFLHYSFFSLIYYFTFTLNNLYFIAHSTLVFPFFWFMVVSDILDFN